MAIYYFLIGIPGSGKSTYAASLGCRVVCPDIIREERGWRPDAPEAFEIARSQILKELLAGRDVVFDATNTVRDLRAEMIAVGKPYADRVVCIWMDTPLMTCMWRNLERGRQGGRRVPPDVMERMARHLADNPPELSEGFDEIRRVTPDEERRT